MRMLLLTQIIYDAVATDDDGDHVTLSIDQTDPSDDSDKVSMNSDGEVTECTCRL